MCYTTLSCSIFYFYRNTSLPAFVYEGIEYEIGDIIEYKYPGTRNVRELTWEARCFGVLANYSTHFEDVDDSSHSEDEENSSHFEDDDDSSDIENPVKLDFNSI